MSETLQYTFQSFVGNLETPGRSKTFKRFLSLHVEIKTEILKGWQMFEDLQQIPEHSISHFWATKRGIEIYDILDQNYLEKEIEIFWRCTRCLRGSIKLTIPSSVIFLDLKIYDIRHAVIFIVFTLRDQDRECEELQNV